MSISGKSIGATALTVMLGLACISPQAFAQIPGSLVVKTTSPSPGASVNGTVPVNASVTVVGALIVAGVQFKLDGANLGAEDTTAPYSVSWNTTVATDGVHTLTAVARDVLGIQYAAEAIAVTVVNSAPPSVAAKRYEETDASVSLSAGGWAPRSAATGDWLGWSGGAAAVSNIPNARATFAFTGTAVTWIGYRSVESGIARVYMDGAFVADVDMFARRDEASTRVFTVKGLANGSHTLAIEVSGIRNPEAQSNLVIVDAFDVPAPVVSHIQDTDPDVSYTAGWAQLDVSKPWSGGFAAVSATAGDRATVTFNGTAITWVGYRGSDTGIARVFLDGALAGEVDTHSTSMPRVQDVLFKATGLADGKHTLAIEATGRQNPGSTGTLIVVDAFDVTAPGVRFQETDAQVAYSGEGWVHGNLNRTWSEGTAAAGDVAGARATFTFTGTSVSWIGCRKLTTGIGRVYIDGVFVAEIDTYLPPPVEAYQHTVYRATGLANGTHTITIEATGRKHPDATSAYVVVDAFDVRP